ncbi:MAG TPA: hypothetical protein DCZ23_04885 [Lachnospiraceae bacterium]|nr:hypothetical protein [Lachnospiraceae bacterium]
MSNLIKSVYFTNVNEGEKCIIDSDSRIEEFIPGIYSQPGMEGEPGAFQFRQLSDIAGDASDGQFTEGMNIISMEDVLDEERQKLSEETEIMSGEILNEAQAQADEIIAKANIAAENIRNQAYEAGLAQGIEEGKKQGAVLLEEKRKALAEDYNNRLRKLEAQEKELEPHFASIIAGLVEKLTGVICENKKDVIVHLINKALKNLEKTNRIVLRVSRDDIAVVSSKRNELMKGIKEGTEFEIIEDVGLVSNQCIIETDNKIVDCSLDAQLDNLRKQIKMITM